jgi:uncharacterized protein YeeX (DUF496 family)
MNLVQNSDDTLQKNKAINKTAMGIKVVKKDFGSRIDNNISVPCGINKKEMSAKMLKHNKSQSSRNTNNKSLNICSHWLFILLGDIAIYKG